MHIVSFDVPYPDDYGGAVDVFHKIRHLKQVGYRIVLHCFRYGRPEQPILSQFAEEVYYYRRDTSFLKLASPTPYIVSSRRNRALLQRLKSDRHPVLLEGLHCTAFLDELADGKRRVIVRTHNIEQDYYRELARQETSPLKKWYLSWEGSKLEGYEAVLRHADYIASISEKDHDHFGKRYGKSFLLPPFHRADTITVKPGRGTYCLYHGNLSVAENHRAAMWLLTDVMPRTKIKLVVAGHRPRRELIQLIQWQSHAELISDPGREKMEQLISNAQVHLLPSFQATGIKLKLIHALFAGRHIIINSDMMQPGLEKLVTVADSAVGFADALEDRFESVFTEDNLAERTSFLEERFSNSSNARLLSDRFQL